MGLGFTALMCLLLLILPRQYALVPVIILTCYMTMGERIIVAGLNFTMLRVLTVVGWVRILIRGELESVNLNPIDKAVIWWTISSIVAYLLLWQTYDALKYKFGLAYNALGMYFLFRFLVRDMDDLVRVLKIVAVFIIPLAGSMVMEKMTGQNSFAVFGGVSPITFVRDGVLRCQGPFAHPILAGTFGATLMPLFVGLWWQRSDRFLAALAIFSTTIITLTAGSSGPVGAYLAGITGLVMWRFRHHMRKVRWGIVLCLSGLQIAMTADVWFLISRVGVFSGSDGWHRGYLIDRAVYNFWDWWLVGTKSTEKWGYSLWDVTNQFVAEGANGGLMTLLLFTLIIGRCFRGVGLAVRIEADPPPLRLGIWALGVALLAHVIGFMSVSYWDQNYVNWYLLVAMISAATGPVLLAQRNAKTSRASRLRTGLTTRKLPVASSQCSAVGWSERGDSLSNSPPALPRLRKIGNNG